MKHIPALTCGCLDCQAETTPGCRTVCLLIVLLFLLKTPEDVSGLRLQEVPVFVSLQGKNPATGDPISDMNLSHID